MANPAEELKLAKAAERRQLASGERPSLTQFWNQPHGVSLLLVKGNVLEKAASVVIERGQSPSRQKLGTMTAYPAHVGTLLSRRRKGSWSVMNAAWFSSGWTKIQETTGGTVTTDTEQISSVARSLGAFTVGLHYHHYIGNVGLIEANPDGTIHKETYLTAVLTTPDGRKWHADVAKDPNPTGMTKALHAIGFEVNDHLLDEFEMITILSDYGN